MPPQPSKAPSDCYLCLRIEVLPMFQVKHAAPGEGPRKLRSRPGETLFIDARRLGVLVDRVHRDLADADIARVTDTYHEELPG